MHRRDRREGRGSPRAGARALPPGKLVALSGYVHTGPRDATSSTWAARRELLLCAAITAAVSGLLLVVVPRGGDAAAHLYRTLLVRHGFLVWDNLWFAGQYPLSSYSVLYYLPAALVGNVPLSAAAVVLASLLFADLVNREWGAIGRWPSRVFALVAAGQFFTGAYPYTLGFATLLVTLWALQRGRTWLGVAGAALTLGFSPLAFLFLCLALLALFLRSRHVGTRVVVLGATLALLSGLELTALLLFPTPRLYYPYGLWRLVAGLAVGGMGAALSLRGRGGAPLASLFLVWTAASVVFYLVPSPVGHNVVRPAAFVLPLMLLAALLAGFRPRWLAVPAIAAALASNVVPYLTMIPDRATDPAGNASFWTPILRFLREHPAPGYRIEAVPTANHWETFFLPRAGYALARGWYRQLDIGDNPTLYRARLTPAAYRGWLRSVGVRYVVLPQGASGAMEAGREASLLRSGRSGLREVFSAADGTIYELPGAVPILTGPGRASITTLGHSLIEGRVAAPGVYRLRIHYSPYLQVRRGALCLRPAPDGMTELDAARAGPFSLRAAEQPGNLLDTLIDGDPSRCGPASTAR